jgi:predicted dehydrogenase
MDRVGLGVVGLGWWGGVLAKGARDSGQAEVVAGFARSEEARAAYAAEQGCRAAGSLEELLADPAVEGVLVATPHSTHLGIVERAAEAGKHVFVEKPLTLTVDEAKRAIEATERAGVVLQVGQNRRRQPANRRIKELLDEGELGTPLQLEGFHSSPSGFKPDLPAWRKDPDECPAGGMAACGVHTVDTFRYLVGPARRVVAFTKPVAGITDLDEATAAIVEYESGPIGTIGTSYFVAPVVSLAVYGTDASAWNEEDGAKLYLQRRGEPVRSPVPVDPADTIADEVGEFARCIRDGGAPETGGPEGLEVAAVFEAIVTSAATGRAVELSELR